MRGHNEDMRRLLPLLLVPLLVLAWSGPALAVDAERVAVALRSSPVYQEPGVDVVDVVTLTAELTADAPRVVVAVLSTEAASDDAAARSQAIAIGSALLESDLVVLVVTADGHYGTAAGKAAVSRGVDAREALAAERESVQGAPFDKDIVTALVTSFAQRIAGQAARDESVPVSRSSGNGLLLLLLVMGAAGGGVLLLVRSARQRRARLLQGLRSEIDGLYARLAADITDLEPGEDMAAKQALADASERYSACGEVLAEADTPSELAVARRTALEGLTAARVARTALGLDPGPDLPAVVPGTGPQLAVPERVAVGGQVFEGSPAYEPGRKHYFGGGTVDGRQVPGGWYGVPFWEPFLLGSILTGGFGGFGGFGHGDSDGDGDGDGGDGADGGGGGDFGGGGGDF